MARTVAAVLMVVATLVLYPAPAAAHCDAMDGPVVQAARTALDKNDVGLVLRWVAPDREADVRAAFTRTLAVRALGGDARALADTWFFETLVRIHRAGEGAPYDGLKPAGHIEPFVAAVDRSLATGSVEPVVAGVTAHVSRSVRERFTKARDTAARADTSVEAGRAYVAAYVDYLHYVEALHKAGATDAAAHGETATDGHRDER
jgi:hypothetical protein